MSADVFQVLHIANTERYMKKAEARKYYLQKRKAFSEKEIVEQSQKIADLFFENFDLSYFETIHIFLPILKQKEIDTFLIINKIQSDFKKVKIAIPRVIPESFEMESYLFTNKDDLLVNKWEILEPNPNAKNQIRHAELSAVLIPLLIFDTQGNRVGYGKGFYDRFLAECQQDVLKIGLCFEKPLDIIEDVNELDIKLDFCIIPEKVYNFKV